MTRTSRPVTARDVRRWIELRRAGKTIIQIAAVAGRDRSSIDRYLYMRSGVRSELAALVRDAGLPEAGHWTKFVSPAEIDEMIRLRRTGLTGAEIAARLGRHRTTVHRYFGNRTVDRNPVLATWVASAGVPIKCGGRLEFTPAEVRRMRALQAAGYGYTRITRLINADRREPVSRIAVLQVLKGRRKRYAAILAEPVPDTAGIDPAPDPRRKITPAEIARAKGLRATGMSYERIAAALSEGRPGGPVSSNAVYWNILGRRDRYEKPATESINGRASEH